MADWSGDKVNPSDINGGKEYEAQTDRVSIESFNAIVNNSIYSARASAEALEKADSAFQGNGTIVRVDGVSKGYIDFDSDPQSQIDELSNKFYHQWDSSAGAGQTISGGTSAQIIGFESKDIEIPRSGVYEISTIIDCYCGNGGDGVYYVAIDGNLVGTSCAVLGSTEHVPRPHIIFVEIEKGMHSFTVIGSQWNTSRTLDISPYAVNQLLIKEL